MTIEFYKNGNGNHECAFTTELAIDNGYTNKGIGKHRSTMELFIGEDKKPTMIEWDVADIGKTEHIGLWFDGMDLVDYDGIFALPVEAAKLIRHAGFKVSTSEFLS